MVDSVREKRATFTLRARSPTIGILRTKRCHTGRPPALLIQRRKPQIVRVQNPTTRRKWLRRTSALKMRSRVFQGRVLPWALNILVISGMTAIIKTAMITAPTITMITG